MSGSESTPSDLVATKFGQGVRVGVIEMGWDSGPAERVIMVGIPPVNVIVGMTADETLELLRALRHALGELRSGPR